MSDSGNDSGDLAQERDRELRAERRFYEIGDRCPRCFQPDPLDHLYDDDYEPTQPQETPDAR